MCMSLHDLREGESGDDFFARWFDRAQAGCRECLAGLFETFTRALRMRISRALHHDPRTKELRWYVRDSDLFQQSLMEAQRDIKQFRGKTRAEFMKWLFQIIIHNCEDLRRYYQAGGRHNPKVKLSLNDSKQAAQYVEKLASNEAAPAEAAIAREERDLLAEALQKLPMDYRSIIQWRDFDEISFVEIGNRLGKSDDTARRMYDDAVERLGTALAGLR